jgi:UDP-N-acetylmuramate--alanine ligase
MIKRLNGTSPQGFNLNLSNHLGVIHFVGIGGIGMSGIAEILLSLNHQISGSDLSENANVKRLRAKGIAISIGHAADHLGQADVVVVSSAVRADNPEVVAARQRRIPVVTRADMLAELMRFASGIAIGGTHGKTTTTSLVGQLLEVGGLDPTVINGGIVHAYGTNVRLGHSQWMVVESDESDGSFTRLPAHIVVVTNIDPEHLEHYGSFDALKDSFRRFISNIPFYGFAVVCADHPIAAALASEIHDRRVLTYGIDQPADVTASAIAATADGLRFDASFGGHSRRALTLPDLLLPMHGRHNVLNALAAMTVANELGIAPEAIARALQQFQGVNRRFTKVATVAGATIIDDYAHHPVEIAAVLAAARESCAASGQTGAGAQARVIAVFQPHRYSRVANLLPEFASCFGDADRVLVSDIYSAGETPLDGISQEVLLAQIAAQHNGQVQGFQTPEQLGQLLRGTLNPGDVVVCMGAGSITNWAHQLPELLTHATAEQAA